jgi:hypothetical protein
MVLNRWLFHTIAIQIEIQIMKKIAKLNIGYCSSKFRRESQIQSTAEYSKRKI